MATAEQILVAAGGSYPSSVKDRAGEPGWLDLIRTVRVVTSDDRFEGVCLVNPSKGLAILNFSKDTVPIAGLVVGEFQGRIVGDELTEEDMDGLETFLNVVADERDSSGQIQTANAAAARVWISRLFMMRKKGLSHKPKSGS